MFPYVHLDEEVLDPDGPRFVEEVGDERFGVESFLDGLERAGALDAPADHEIVTYRDGDPVYRATLAPGLAERLAAGEWDGSFVVTFPDREAARRAREAIRGE